MYPVQKLPVGPMKVEVRQRWRRGAAMHLRGLLCVGMYGQTFPNQDEAPMRVVVPGKNYGIDMRRYF